MSNTIDRIIDLAIQIQQIPAPTFHEQKRAEFVRKLFVNEGLQDVTMDEAGNVYGRFQVSGNALSVSKGSGSQVKPLIVSAHMDTVFPLEMDLSIRREDDKVYGIGIGDNSLGVAALFGLMWILNERRFDYALPTDNFRPERSEERILQRTQSKDAPLSADNIWFVANVCEEGLGDLRGMKAVVDRFGSEVKAYLVLEGMALGNIYHRAVGVKRYRVTARTQGGHSWSDYGQPSAVLELSKLIVQLAALKLPSHPRTTMNVGKVQGGTSVNAIAAEAWMELDLRSEGSDELKKLVGSVEGLIEAVDRPEVRFEAQVVGERPAGEIPSDHPLTKLAEECLLAQGLDSHLTLGSTDANIPLSRGYPALVLGVTRGGGAHTKNEFIELPPIEKGMKQLVKFIESVWG